MSVFKYIRTVYKFYMLFIQPLLGLCIIGYSLWVFYSPVETVCVTESIESCTSSASVIVRACIYLVIGMAVLAVWFFTDLQPKLRGEDKEKSGSGVKPEDFVK